MRSFFVVVVVVVGSLFEVEEVVVVSLGAFSGCGEGRLTILPASRRSDKPLREGAGEAAF